MKLFYSPGACSQAPHILVHELGIPVATEKVNLRNKGNYADVNPKGYVPALQLDDGSLLTEAAVIMQYLADQAPEKKLIPKAGTLERYRELEWLNFVSTEIHKGLSPFWKPTTPEVYRETLKETLKDRFTHLDKHLAQNKFLMGDQMTVADIYLFVVTNWTKYLKIDISAHKNLMRFLEDMAQRPAVVATMAAEGINK